MTAPLSRRISADPCSRLGICLDLGRSSLALLSFDDASLFPEGSIARFRMFHHLERCICVRVYIIFTDVEGSATAVSRVRFAITVNGGKSMLVKQGSDVEAERRQIRRNRNLRSCSGCSKHRNGCRIVFSAWHVCCSNSPPL